MKLPELNDARISEEIGGMLVSCLILKELRPESQDLIQNLKTMHLTLLLTQDIILRLYKLSDERKGTLSFKYISRHCSQSVVERRRDRALRPKLNNFRKLTKDPREHRHSYIGHLSSDDDRTHLAPLVNLYDAVREAVEIWDFLIGDKVTYSLHGELDLRTAVFGNGGWHGLRSRGHA